MTYRSFAWVGFLANFIFIAAALISVLIQLVIYPKSEPTTYISDAVHAAIIPMDPSVKSHSLNIKSLKKQLPHIKQETIHSDQWYYETVKNQRNERFPYLLAGTSPKWGSGLHPLIFIEKDGKGLLLSTPEKQLYFRSEASLIKEGK
ncbi:hypothetical protein [Metabacillus sp. RGM 3146]|uniref:hypothetical protein n=1 Tax=Metabacillus sp. RGM 3146 TaxID=3401092 RepID=UPI003B9B58F1